MPRRKILLAEDDADDQLLFSEFLNHRDDIEILPAVENGAALIELLEGIKEETAMPQLIILDHNMPKKNGVQTLEYLKRAPRFRHIPVMIYSTYVDEQLQQSTLKLGASLVYGKPYTKKGYGEMIDAFLHSI